MGASKRSDISRTLAAGWCHGQLSHLSMVYGEGGFITKHLHPGWCGWPSLLMSCMLVVLLVQCSPTGSAEESWWGREGEDKTEFASTVLGF